MRLLIAELPSQPVWVSQGCFDNVPPPLSRTPPVDSQANRREMMRSYGMAGGALPSPALGCVRDARGAIKSLWLGTAERGKHPEVQRVREARPAYSAHRL